MVKAILVGVLLAGQVFGNSLQESFLAPPDSARPWVYWINMDGHLNKEGITADLESMKDVGISGVLYMDVDVGVPRGPVPFMSETWQKNITHAVHECERLGLEFTTITGPGWTGTGGPWIKADQSMQHLVPVSVNTKGPAKFNQVLPLPEPRVMSYHRRQTPKMRKELAEFYEDVAVYAFPRRDPVIKDVDEKALFLRNPYTSRRGVREHLPSPVGYPAAVATQIVNPDDMIDLTDRLQSDGRLEWEVPAGEWTILRMGRRSTGSNTRPAPAAGLGFEGNKFDKKPLETHFNAYFDPLLKRIGPRSKDRTTGFTALDADSWEMGAQNWTPGFREAFKELRGYDPWPYFPAYSGRIVGSREITERFLWDIRMTCQDLLLENHMGHMKKLCEDRGLKLMIEPYDMNPTVDLDLGSFADIPMGEFWHNSFKSAWSCIEAASIGHTMGKPIVAAEAFTAHKPYWKETPWTKKNQSDWAFAIGINRFVIVNFPHQPSLDKAPGMMFGPYGLNWARTLTYWPLLTDYHQYLARCSHLLQQGVTVSDILYLTPEGAPHVLRAPDSALHDAQGWLPDKKGYSFDGCSPRILMNRAEVKDGLIAFPGGTSYRLLVLPNYETMTPQLLSKIQELVKAGATVYGAPPAKSPSLSNYPQCDETLASMVQEIWGSEKERNLGNGRIICAPKGEGLYPDYAATSALLKSMGVAEDFESDGPIRYTHRRTESEDIYFVANRTDKPVNATCRFRVTEGAPVLMDSVTGKSRALPEFAHDRNITSVPMVFDAFQSYFVIFARSDKPPVPAGGVNFPETVAVATLDGSWEVSFDPKWGGPENITFPKLQDWSQHENEGIRFYSGLATYRKTFDAPPRTGKPVYLDLGTVHEIARVKLNGKELGGVWCAPWRIDISDALKEKGNLLEIEVANLWPNRLIGDAGKQPKERLTSTAVGHPYKANTRLLPSGLLGPVRIINNKEIK